jgi:hypothetical protein
MRSDGFGGAREVEVVSEENFRVHHVEDLDETAPATENKVEREERFRFEIRGALQQRIRERLIAKGEHKLELRATARPTCLTTVVDLAGNARRWPR